MTEKDDIIENHESGRKPRKILKSEVQDKTKSPFLKEEFLEMFDPSWMDMTLRRIRGSQSSGAYYEGNWHKVAEFHDAVVGLSKLLRDLVYNCADNAKKSLEIHNRDHTEYYVFIDQNKNYLARLLEPRIDASGFFKRSNKAINKNISDLNRESGYGLTFIELDGEELPTNQAWHVPFLRDDATIPKQQQDYPGHIITLSYVPKPKGVNIESIVHYDRGDLLKTLQETLNLPIIKNGKKK